MTLSVKGLFVPDSVAWVSQKSPGIVLHSSLESLQRMVWKTKNIQWAEVPWGENSLVNERGQRRGMVWLVQTDRKATVTEIIACYNSGTQNISEHPTRRTLRWMGDSRRRPICLKNKFNGYRIYNGVSTELVLSPLLHSVLKVKITHAGHKDILLWQIYSFIPQYMRFTHTENLQVSS